MLIIGGSIAALLIVTGYFVVNYIGDTEKHNVEQQLRALSESEAASVEGFFAQYGGVASTLISSPYLQSVFSAHSQRGQSPTSSGQIPYEQLFSSVSEQDHNIKSAFFGSATTGEYFYEQGAVGVDTSGPDAGVINKGYFATKRPWFNEAVDKGKLYVTSPSVDSQDGSVSAVVQAPVFYQGELIGVGGVDILISTIGEFLSDVNYRGQGFAFLVDEQQRLVYFPESGRKLAISTPLAQLDTEFQDTTGFGDLAKQLKHVNEGFAELTWQQQEYIVVFKHALLHSPDLNWSLGIAIPKQLVDEPVQQAFTSAVVAFVLIVLIVSVVTYFTAVTIVKPIERMRDAMLEIANGDGDLTRQLPKTTEDEFGDLADAFNDFLTKLRELIEKTAHYSTQVNQASAALRDVSRGTNAEIKQEREQVDVVNASVVNMVTMVEQISTSASASSESVAVADEKVKTAVLQARQVTQDNQALVASIEKGVNVVETLSEESTNIGAVVDVINSIAEQTNLLALNAAIEAARAGEQGRGFAVVADEVRSLARRTQDSTDDIRRMVERLQEMANQTQAAMIEGQHNSQASVDKTKEVVNFLGSVETTMSHVHTQSSGIEEATRAQSHVADNISHSLATITALSGRTSDYAESLEQQATHLSDVAERLQSMVGQFKV